MIQSKNIIGKNFSLDFNGTLPAGMTSALTGSTTVTNKTKSVEYAGGSGSNTNFTQYIQVTQYAYGDNILYRLIFKPVVAGAITLLINSIGNTVYYARVNTSTGAITTGSSGDQNTSSSISFTNNVDLLLLEVTWSRDSQNFTSKITNIRNGLSSESATTTGVSITPPRVANARVCFHSGTTEIFNISCFNFLSKNNKVLFLGDSNTYNITTTIADRFVTRAQRDSNEDVDCLAWSGSTTAQLILLQNDIISTKAEYVYIMIGTNDLNGGVLLSTYSANIDTLINAITGYGGKVVLLSIMPNNQPNFAQIPTWNSTLSGKANGTTIFYVDCYTTMDNGSGHLQAGYTTDGVHLSTAGYNNLWTVCLYPSLRNYIQI